MEDTACLVEHVLNTATLDDLIEMSIIGDQKHSNTRKIVFGIPDDNPTRHVKTGIKIFTNTLRLDDDVANDFKNYRITFSNPTWVDLCSRELETRLQLTDSPMEKLLSIRLIALKSKLECKPVTIESYNYEHEPDPEGLIDTGNATRVLVQISDLLKRKALLELRDNLLEFYHSKIPHYEELYHGGFDMSSFLLLPILSKKHPSLQIDVRSYVHDTLKAINLERNHTEMANFVTSIVFARSLMTHDVCEMVLSFIQIFEFDDPTSVYSTCAKLAKRKLSRSSMAWLRIRWRVRVVSYLSLMRNEAAERLYQPSGEGACAAKRNFETMAATS